MSDGWLVDVDMHFWDAPDHISKANFELMLDNNRMYFHEATGHFGALPLIVSGWDFTDKQCDNGL